MPKAEAKERARSRDRRRSGEGRDRTAQNSRRQGQGIYQAQNDAAEIKLRAERRLGELLAEQKAAGERQTQGTHKKLQRETSSPPPPTLRDLGIEKTQAKRWQDVARVPEKKFEAFLAPQLAPGRAHRTRTNPARTRPAAPFLGHS